MSKPYSMGGHTPHRMWKLSRGCLLDSREFAKILSPKNRGVTPSMGIAAGGGMVKREQHLSKRYSAPQNISAHLTYICWIPQKERNLPIRPNQRYFKKYP